MRRDILITHRSTDSVNGFAVTIPINGRPADILLQTARRMRPDSIWTDDLNCYTVARKMGIDINFIEWEGLFTK